MPLNVKATISCSEHNTLVAIRQLRVEQGDSLAELVSL